jgi:hypothetical protein
LRYFFHFASQGAVFEDAKGESFADLDGALDHALRLVAQLETEEAVSLDRAVLVADEKGNEMARLPVEKRLQSPPFEDKHWGYTISAKSVNGLWRVEVTPTQADLPILRRYRFLINAWTGEAAIKEARGKIDQLLSA